LTKRSTFS